MSSSGLELLQPSREDVVLGVQRPSMKENALLQRAELEKCLSQGHTLPNVNFTYGMPSRKSGGAADALNNWDEVANSCPVRTVRQKDFVAMNRSAICLGLWRNRDHIRFRRCHPMTVRPPRPRRGVLPRRGPEPPDIAHGVRHRPSTPMVDVLSNKYGRDFKQKILIQDEKKRVICERQSQPSVIGKIIHTKKSSTAAQRIKLSVSRHRSGVLLRPSCKYTHVSAELDTFPSERERCAALEKRREREEHEERLKLVASLQRRVDELNETIPVKLRSRSIQNPKRPTKVYGAYTIDPNTGAKRGDPDVREPPPPRPSDLARLLSPPPPWKPSPIAPRP